jgi:putative component of membrane protein insertase Oxa1/YidC/SpoIIIJ protein YidD
MAQTGYGNSSLITLAVAAFVVVRFALRELKPRIVRVKYLWIRPALLAVMTVLILAACAFLPTMSYLVLGVSCVFGIAIGAVVGIAVVRLSRFEPTGNGGEVRVVWSWKTAAVWIVAVLFRVVARFAIPTSDQAAQSALNAGLIMLIFVAFAIVAAGFHREVDRARGLAVS